MRDLIIAEKDTWYELLGMWVLMLSMVGWGVGFWSWLAVVVSFVVTGLVVLMLSTWPRVRRDVRLFR